MELIDGIYSRRSVRAYSQERIDEVRIRKLLQAAVQAPSAMNAQPWRFVVLQDRTRLRRYSDRAKARMLAEWSADAEMMGRYRQMLESPEFNIFYNAGTLIVICARPVSVYAQADCWLAAQNLQLTACVLGLGTCCIGFALGVLNEPDIKAELGIPADVAAVAPLIVGTPGALPPPVPRAEPVILSWTRPLAG